MTPKILLAGEDSIFMVAKQIKSDLKDVEFISLYPQLAKSLTDIDIPCKSIEEFATGPVRLAAATDAAQVIRGVYDALGPQSERLAGLLKEYFIKNTPGFVFNNIQSLSILVHAVTAVNPDLVILHNDVEPMTRVAAMWCQVNKRPCLHVPHAVYLDYERTAPGTDIHDVITVSHLAAGGLFQAQWYMERGFNPENIKITGVPRFDRMYSVPIDRDRACTLLGFDPAKPVVGYFSSWRQDTNLLGCNDGIEESYQFFLEAVKEIPGLQVVIKCHPRGNNVPWHAEVAGKAGVRCVATDKYLEVVLQAMNLGIIYGPSNVALEGAILGKTWISINGFDNDPEVLTIKPNKDMIAQAIIAGLRAPKVNYTRFIEKYIGFGDNLATIRVARYAEELL